MGGVDFDPDYRQAWSSPPSGQARATAHDAASMTGPTAMGGAPL